MQQSAGHTHDCPASSRDMLQQLHGCVQGRRAQGQLSVLLQYLSTVGASCAALAPCCICTRYMVKCAPLAGVIRCAVRLLCLQHNDSSSSKTGSTLEGLCVPQSAVCQSLARLVSLPSQHRTAALSQLLLRRLEASEAARRMW